MMDREIKYKQNILVIGKSDISTLLFVGPDVDESSAELNVYQANYPGNGAYNAYFVDQPDVCIPKHYRKVAEFRSWLTIYDDSSCSGTFFVADGEIVEVFRAGSYGMIIKAKEFIKNYGTR